MPHYITTPEGRKIAYDFIDGKQPGVVFLGGYMSDMGATKATYLYNWAKECGRAYVRFDYSGHGASSGEFIDGTISDWAADARVVFSKLCQGPQILVGSSMGGWIALLLARQMTSRIAAIVTIAGAPDFTEECMWNSFDQKTRETLMREGQIVMQCDYDDDYVITRKIIEDGRKNFVLRNALKCPFPVRILHGSADKDVPPFIAERLFYHLEGDDIRMHLIKGADHRFSSPSNLAFLRRELEDLCSA